jgi:hypothetical protein
LQRGEDAPVVLVGGLLAVLLLVQADDAQGEAVLDEGLVDVEHLAVGAEAAEAVLQRR